MPQHDAPCSRTRAHIATSGCTHHIGAPKERAQRRQRGAERAQLTELTWKVDLRAKLCGVHRALCCRTIVERCSVNRSFPACECVNEARFVPPADERDATHAPSCNHHARSHAIMRSPVCWSKSCRRAVRVRSHAARPRAMARACAGAHLIRGYDRPLHDEVQVDARPDCLIAGRVLHAVAFHVTMGKDGL